jgi:hypothetical protein
VQLDYERAEQKRTELINIADKAILDYMQENDSKGSETEIRAIASLIIEKFAKVSPPEKEDFDTVSFILLSAGGRGGGRSLKPGNVRLNMLKLMHALAGGVISVAAAVKAPWLVPFVAVRTWNDLWTSLNVNITEREAAILWTMWKYKDINNNMKSHKRYRVKRFSRGTSQNRKHRAGHFY